MVKMDIGLTILNQITMMFVMMGFGYFIYYYKFMDDLGTQQVSNILLKICGPCTIITAFNFAFNASKLKKLGFTIVLSTIVILIGLGVARLIYGKSHRLEQFAIAFSNAGFIGIPLVTGLLGVEYVFYLTGFLICFNLFVWTVGVYLISGQRSLITPKLMLFNPALIGTAIGLIVFVSPIKPIAPVADAIAKIGFMNTPLAMIVLGTFIAKSNLVEVFTNKAAYVVSFMRLIVVPLIILFGLKLVPNAYHDIKMVILIAASAPVGVMVAMFAQQYEGDYEYGARIVSLSTILCLFTIPGMLLLSNIVW